MRESDSPRGRIALIEGLQSGALQATPELLAHLDRCLLCRACEAQCPARVEYNLLMDLARERLFTENIPPYRLPWKVRMLTLSLSASPQFLRLSGFLIHFYQRSGLQWLVRKTGVSGWFGLADYEAIIPPRGAPFIPPAQAQHKAAQNRPPNNGTPLPLTETTPSPSEKHATTLAATPLTEHSGRSSRTVAIFQGCMGAMLDSVTVESTRKILRALGYDPVVITTQQCCGALALHQGDAERARKLARNNIRAFAAAGSPIVFIATGCGTLLKEYAQLFEQSPEAIEAESFARRCVEICDFIAQDPALAQLTFSPLAARVAVHTPCSLRNVLKCESAVFELLRRIPGVESTPLPSNHLCCGAAGSYMLTQPDISRSLLAIKLRDLAHIEPDLMVSSNIGCLLHIQSGAAQSNRPIPCLHPVTLLAAQLDTSFDSPAVASASAPA